MVVCRNQCEELRGVETKRLQAHIAGQRAEQLTLKDKERKCKEEGTLMLWLVHFLT